MYEQKIIDYKKINLSSVKKNYLTLALYKKRNNEIPQYKISTPQT